MPEQHKKAPLARKRPRVYSASAAYEPSPATRRLLAARYESSDWQNVDNFLLKTPFLEGLLLEAQPKIERHFGKSVRISLNLVDEPEAPGQTELFGFVHTALEPERALRLLDNFDREWWLHAVQRAKGKLNFSLTYD